MKESLILEIITSSNIYIYLSTLHNFLGLFHFHLIKLFLIRRQIHRSFLITQMNLYVYIDTVRGICEMNVVDIKDFPILL